MGLILKSDGQTTKVIYKGSIQYYVLYILVGLVLK